MSLEAQGVLAQPLNPLFLKNADHPWQWEDIAPFAESRGSAGLALARKMFPVAVAEEMHAGVPCYLISPPGLPDAHQDLLLLHVHRGGFVSLGGERCLPDAMALAHHGRYRILVPNYRIPPEFPYPAALDDVVAVYREMLSRHAPAKIGLFGTSSGGGLATAMILRLQELRAPLPAAVALGFPWTDLSKTGDSYFTNAEIDHVLVKYDGMVEAWARLYAGGQNLANPYLSPIHGKFDRDFPPTLLISGTRDLFLSNTVRLQRKLRQAGVDARLQIFEGMAHAFYAEMLDTPESEEAYREIALFLDKQLTRNPVDSD